MKIKSFLAAVASTAGILTLAQPASAVIYDWQFTNEDGNFGDSTDVVAGFVEFSATSFNDLANQSNVPAINLQITSVTGLTPTSPPFFGDGGIELNTNLVARSLNTWNFDGGGEISNGQSDQQNFGSDRRDENEIRERLVLRENGAFVDLVDYSGVFFLEDDDASTIQFTQQASASVPFEFSPTLGLFLVGGMFAGRSYVKRRNSLIK